MKRIARRSTNFTMAGLLGCASCSLFAPERNEVEERSSVLDPALRGDPPAVAAEGTPPAGAEPPPGVDPSPVVVDEPQAANESEETPAETSAAPTLQRLAASATEVDDPSREAWVHYRGKAFASAIPYFAQASLAEPHAWKHPFNLACAAALSGNEAAARLGLAEAVARDRAATTKKARRDTDLDAIRDARWFEPTLRGESSEPADRRIVDAPKLPTKALSGAALRRLSAELEARHGVRVKVRASLALAGDDGETLAWAVYTVGKMDLCLRAESKKACRARLLGEPDMGDYDQTKCGHEFVARARLSEALHLDEPIPLSVPCKIDALRRFEAVDVDADGEAEIVVDVTGKHFALGMHETDLVKGARDVRIFRLDGSTQLEFAVAWELCEIAPGGGTTRMFEWEDTNGDGHPDLVVTTREFEGYHLVFDDAMWLSGPQEDHIEPISTSVHTYVPSRDAWSPPIPPPPP